MIPLILTDAALDESTGEIVLTFLDNGSASTDPAGYVAQDSYAVRVKPSKVAKAKR